MNLLSLALDAHFLSVQCRGIIPGNGQLPSAIHFPLHEINFCVFSLELFITICSSFAFYILFEFHVGQLFDSLRELIFESRVVESTKILFQIGMRTRAVNDIDF